MQALGALGLAVDVEGEARLAAVAQPFLEAEAVALRLGDFLALFVEEHLVIEAFGRAAAEDARDLGRLGDAVDQILAGHFIIDPERDPARRPVDLPLQLGQAAERRLLDAGAVLVVERDQAGLGVDHLDRHLEHAAAGRRDRQERRIGLAPVLAQRRQHHAHDRVPAAQAPCGSPRRSGRWCSDRSPTGIHNRTRSGRGRCAASHCCDAAKLSCVPNGSGILRQRLAEIFGQHRLVGNVVGHLAQPVHVVAERDQPRRRAAGQLLIGLADEGRAQRPR